MDTYTMNRIKSLLRVLSGRTVLRAVLALLLVAACSPLFAQRADVRKAGVYYQDSASTDKQRYCDWGNNLTTERSFVTTPNPASNQNKTDPWVSSALIEYDQPYPSATASNSYPNHCLEIGRAHV